jgi:cobaltochelatase CobS
MSKLGNLKGSKNQETIKNMIKLANLTRTGFANGDISTLMSPRTVISWGQNYKIFKDLISSFKLTFLNKCDDIEKSIISEYFQRCFDLEIENESANT